jgi:mono/diheme cytochrome c family protein
MRYGIRVLIALLFASSVVVCSQTSADHSLTETQKTGRRLFQQRCAVCHTPPMVISKQYGPALNADTILGREESIRSTIAEGEIGLMPGFKYTLEPSEINAIIKYLKTVEKPAKPAPNWISEH